MITRTATLLVVLFLLARASTAQGLPFHAESALTTAFEERGLRAVFALAQRDDLTVATTRLGVLPFAPHQRVTTAVVIPMVYKRLTEPARRYTNIGLGDVTATAKWAFFARDRFAGTSRMALVATTRLPTGPTGALLDNGTPAPRPLQLGTGAFAGGATLVATIVRDRWGLTLNLGHTRSATDDGYRFGAATNYDVAFGFRFPGYIETSRTQTLQFYLEWNGVVSARDRQNGSQLPNTGGHVLFLSPGIQWVVLPQLLIEGSAQVPLVQDLKGAQPDFDLRAAVGSRLLFF